MAMTDETKTRPATPDGQAPLARPGPALDDAATPPASAPPASAPAADAATRPGPAPAPTAGRMPLGPPDARLQIWEIVAVFAVSLGASGLYALVNLIGSLTAPQSLGKQTTVLNGSLAPGRPLLDLTLQLLNITLSLAPVLLVFYLLARAGEGPSSIGVDASQPGRDLARGAGLAAVIGGTGLGLYLIAYHVGVELNVVAENLPDIWWRIPVLVLSAAHNAIVEEVIMIGYLLSRLDRLGVRPARAILLSAVIRGSYHLYQGVGAFLGNAVMGLIFGYLYRRWGRVMPMVIAHFLIDAVTFVGYALLAGHVSWLPRS